MLKPRRKLAKCQYLTFITHPTEIGEEYQAVCNIKYEQCKESTVEKEALLGRRDHRT